LDAPALKIAGNTAGEIVERDAARIVLIDTAGRVLLQEVEGWAKPGSIWITPGGGLEPGESFEEAAVREVREEVGHPGVELGPCIWTRRHSFTFLGKPIRQSERFFLARTEPFEVDASGLDDLELEVVKGHRWWTLDEIAAAPPEVFAPHGFAALLEPLLRGEIPGAPIALPPEN
jgi:8-oxo-dGTP pyrophosphatase MutT (NUDIX family)